MTEQEEEISNSKINSWINGVLHDDNIKIDDLLITFCNHLSLYYGFSEVNLTALKNGDVINLHNNCSDSFRSVCNSIKPPKYKGENTALVEHDGIVSVFIYIPVYDTPRFIIHAVSSTKCGACHSSLKTLAKQIKLLVRFKEERRLDLVHKNLVRDFFAHNMDVDEAWKTLSRYVGKFLPDVYPFNSGSESLAQVLTYSEGDKFLVLRASQEEKGSQSQHANLVSLPMKLKVDETVCGIPIETDSEYLITNPQEYPDRYQAYLFANHIAKSELVFPIRRSDQSIIAVINFEHKEENVFGKYSIRSMRRAVEVLEPFVSAVITKEKNHKNKEISLLYITNEIIQRMSSLYRHKIGTKLMLSRFIVNDFKAKYLEDTEFQNDLVKLTENINYFTEATSTFLGDLPNYMKQQKINLISTINRAKNDLDSEKLRDGDKIEININSYAEDIYVYASDMLKEHFYNLLNNSILAIKQRISDGKQVGGTIDIVISHKAITDTRKENIHTSPSRIYIEIIDDGGGVPSKYWPGVLDYGQSTRLEKGGTGYGLPAARDYIKFINGGDWDPVNNEGVGLTIKFFIQEFNTSFHEQ